MHLLLILADSSSEVLGSFPEFTGKNYNLDRPAVPHRTQAILFHQEQKIKRLPSTWCFWTGGGNWRKSTVTRGERVNSTWNDPSQNQTQNILAMRSLCKTTQHLTNLPSWLNAPQQREALTSHLKPLTHTINTIMAAKCMWHCKSPISTITFHRMLLSVWRKWQSFDASWNIQGLAMEVKGQLRFWYAHNVINHSWRGPPCASCEDDE